MFQKKMKKLSILILAGLLLPAFVFGAVEYSRTPSGYTITNPIVIDVVLDDILEVCVYEGYTNYWGIEFWGFSSGPIYSEAMASTTLSHSFIVNLPIDEYAQIGGVCDSTSDLCQTKSGGEEYLCNDFAEPEYWPFEYNDGEIIFEVVAGEEEPAKIFTITSTHINQILAYIGELFSGSGVFPLIALITGLFFGFVIVRKVIDLKNEKEKKRKSEKIEVRLKTKKDDWL